jgi:hypothetical protein
MAEVMQIDARSRAFSAVGGIRPGIHAGSAEAITM